MARFIGASVFSILFLAPVVFGTNDSFAQNLATGGTGGYPNRPIRLVVPFLAGGGTDIVARVLAQEMSGSMGQQIVVDNRAGAAGIIGTGLVAKSAPDGYTLVFATLSTAASNAGVYRNLPYDPIKDFAPISLTASSPYIMCANPQIPAKSVAEFVVLAKARPGQLNYGSGGVGAVPHLAGALFGYVAGINMVHIPYKGGAAHIPALAAGEVQAAFTSLVQVSSLVKAGRIRALAVTSNSRWSAVPELPTVAEAGVPGYEFEIWWGLLAPAGTPQQTIDYLYAEVVKAVRSREVKERYGSQVVIVGNKPEEFAAIIRNDVAKWKKVAAAIGLTLNR